MTTTEYKIEKKRHVGTAKEGPNGENEIRQGPHHITESNNSKVSFN